MALQLVLYRAPFLEILAGTKAIEYRDSTPFWQKRLLSAKAQTYEVVKFRNGYRRDSPVMTVSIRKIVQVGDKIEVHLGDVISTANT